MANKPDMTEGYTELVESNVHGATQSQMATILRCAPDDKDIKKAFKKRPVDYFRAFNETAKTEQMQKVGGYGNSSTKNLTININGLGMSEKQALLREKYAKLMEEGRKMGYSSAKVLEAKIVGVNRIKDNV